MSRIVALVAILIGLFLLLRGTHRKAAPMPRDATEAPQVRKGIPMPSEEPSAEVVRTLAFQEYEAIEKAGGLPVTFTATGKSTVLHPKLYEARKDSCHRLPQSLPYEYECDLMIRLSLAQDGSDPSWQGSRLGVKWDSIQGEWRLP